MEILKKNRISEFMMDKGQRIAAENFDSVLMCCEVIESEINNLIYYHYMMVRDFKIITMLGIATPDEKYTIVYSDKYSTNDLVDKIILENNKVKVEISNPLDLMHIIKL